MRRFLFLGLAIAGCEPDGIDQTKGIGIEGDVTESDDGQLGESDRDDTPDDNGDGDGDGGGDAAVARGLQHTRAQRRHAADREEKILASNH